MAKTSKRALKKVQRDGTASQLKTTRRRLQRAGGAWSQVGVREVDAELSRRRGRGGRKHTKGR